MKLSGEQAKNKWLLQPVLKYYKSFKLIKLCVKQGSICLTNRPQFSMVYTLINHRNDVIKCSKLKWNHEPQACGYTAKFWTFYGVISMVYKSVDHRKLWSICFYINIFFYEKPKTKRQALRDMLHHSHGLYSHRP